MSSTIKEHILSMGIFSAEISASKRLFINSFGLLLIPLAHGIHLSRYLGMVVLEGNFTK
jgi:hypothetical protein